MQQPPIAHYRPQQGSMASPQRPFAAPHQHQQMQGVPRRPALPGAAAAAPQFPAQLQQMLAAGQLGGQPGQLLGQLGHPRGPPPGAQLQPGLGALNVEVLQRLAAMQPAAPGVLPAVMLSHCLTSAHVPCARGL